MPQSAEFRLGIWLRKSTQRLQAIGLLLLTLLFLVCVNWLSKVLIQFLFGAEADNNAPLLQKHLSLTLDNQPLLQINVVWLGFILLSSLIVLKVVWYHLSTAQVERRAAGDSLFPGTRQHLSLLVFLTLFGVALGWLSDGISTYLQGYWLSNARPWLFAFGLVLILYECGRTNARLGLLLWMGVYCLLLLVFSSELMWSLVFALFTGYVFFEQVKVYAQPKARPLEGMPSYRFLGI